MDKKVEYIRCPRCELNYIDKREKLCKVCQAELQAKGNKEISDEEAKELNLCPICKKNYLMDDEDICSECASEKAARDNDDFSVSSTDDSVEESDEKSDNWRQYVENDDAEVPEDEYGDMSSITTEDDSDDILDDDLDFDDKDDPDEGANDDELDDDESDDDLDDDLDDDADDSFDKTNFYYQNEDKD